jgi:hypothetical protein
MKTILTLMISLALLTPTLAGRHDSAVGHRATGHNTGYLSGNQWHRERHEGIRGNHGRFHGFNGNFYGQIILLDDGCYFWNGLVWEPTDCD